MPTTKIAFLYTEIAGYFVACATKLAERADVLVVRWPVNKEAPFRFGDDRTISFCNRNDFSDEELIAKVKEFNPDILVCSGWIDKGYLKVVKSFKKSIPTVLTLDNHWTGSLKQKVATVLSPFYLKRLFTHAWVPGEVQATYARKLGFGENVLKGFYCADVDLFNAKYKSTREVKSSVLPKRFLYVARYVRHKGIYDMWQAFKELQEEQPSEWELWCLGTGEEWENRVEHPLIRHIGFVQPEQMNEYISQTGVYVLPSHFEPWGVTVQEFAICGYPMILSDAIGSKEAFLKENGFIFPAGDVTALKRVMRQFMDMSEDKLVDMAQKSHFLGMSHTPEKWANTILSIKKG